jgi:hypothetical protein
MRSISILYLPIICSLVIFPVGVQKPARGSGGDPLRSEATGVAKDFWDNTLLKCGKYYEIPVTFVRNNIAWGARAQYADVSFHLDAEKLSAAQRLNGWEWSGRAYVVYSAMRFSYGPGWDSWKDFDKDGYTLNNYDHNENWDGNSLIREKEIAPYIFYVRKIDGRWRVQATVEADRTFLPGGKLYTRWLDDAHAADIVEWNKNAKPGYVASWSCYGN